MQLLNWIKEHQLPIFMLFLMLLLIYGIYRRDKETDKLHEQVRALRYQEEAAAIRHNKERAYMMGFRKMLLGHLEHYGTIHGEMFLSELYPGQDQASQVVIDRIDELKLLFENYHQNQTHEQVERIVEDMNSILDSTLYLNAHYVAARKAKNGST